MTEEKLNICQKLNKIQTELKAPKNQRNQFGGYNYRSCEDILEAVKPLLSKYGLILTISDDVINTGDRFYVKALVKITDIEDTSQNLFTVAFAREEETKKGMDSAQITGASSSYARKYALNGLFCIDDTKDADFSDHGKEELPTSKASKKTPAKKELTEAERIKAYRDMLISKGQSGAFLDNLVDAFSKMSIEDQRKTFLNFMQRKKVEDKTTPDLNDNIPEF